MTRFLTRRRLAKSALTAAILLPTARLLLREPAVADVPALDPGDPKAKALGYVLKSSKPDANCANCQQFQGKAGGVTGPCTIFPGASVVASGWCLAWVKKSA